MHSTCTALLIFFTRVAWARFVPADLLTFHWIIPDPLLIILISANFPNKLPNRLILILWISPDECAFIDHNISFSIDSGKQNSHSPLSARTASTLEFPRSKYLGILFLRFTCTFRLSPSLMAETSTSDFSLMLLPSDPHARLTAKPRCDRRRTTSTSPLYPFCLGDFRKAIRRWLGFPQRH